MIGVCTDISERKRAEQADRFLADASKALAAVVDYRSTLHKVVGLAVPCFADWCAVDVVEADGSLQRVAVAHIDPAKVKLANELYQRYPPDPTAPHGVWNIIHSGKSELIPEITEELLLATVKEAELIRILQELGLRSYLGVPLIVRGKVLGVLSFIAAESGRRYDSADLGVAEDLAHRAAIAIENARLYGELKEADRRKDEFLATLALELRNPLAPIRNAIELLQRANGNGELIQQASRMMERQVAQMVRLVDDLLDISRVTQGKVQLRKERVELAAVVQSAVEASRPLIEARGHELTIALPDEPIHLEADPTRLAQALANLLNNAAKYSENGGRIWLSAERQGDEVLVSVRDTGIGIAAENLLRIFEMFSQVEPALERSQGGLGIGLALVRGLVELHGGRVEARSPGIGMGSEFVARLPVVASQEGAGKGPIAFEERANCAVRPRRILVVDDNRDASDSLATMLRVMGHETDTAYDGLQAVQATATFRPEVVLLDIGLPRMNGYEAARRIREQPWAKNIALIALTGWGQEDDKRRVLEAGFDHHLTKPVAAATLEKLLALVNPLPQR
jgi:signal transduction histidine kinase